MTADQAPTPEQAARLEHERLTARANDWLHLADEMLEAVAGRGADTSDIDPETVRATIDAAHAAATLAIAYETRAGRLAATLAGLNPTRQQFLPKESRRRL